MVLFNASLYFAFRSHVAPYDNQCNAAGKERLKKSIFKNAMHRMCQCVRDMASI